METIVGFLKVNDLVFFWSWCRLLGLVLSWWTALCVLSTKSKWCLRWLSLCCWITDIRSLCFLLFSSRRDVATFWVSDIEGTKIKVPFSVCAGIFHRVDISMRNKAAFEVKREYVTVHPSWDSSVGGFQGTSVPCNNTWICLQWAELLGNADFMPLPW